MTIARPGTAPPEAREVAVAARPPSGAPPRRRGPSPRGWALVAGLALVASLLVAVAPALGGSALVTSSGLSSLGRFAAAAVAPRLDAEFGLLVLDAALTTVAYAVLGTALALVLGVLGGVLGSRTWWRWGARVGGGGRAGRRGWRIARGLLVVPRGIHEVVWGLILLGVLGLEPIVAVLAIALPFGAITATVFAGILDDADPRPAEALRAAGASRATTMVYGLLPGASAELLSYAFYRFECALRAAAVLGLVGAGGLGFQLALSFQALVLPEIWTLLYALTALCVLADAWSSTVRRRRAGASRDPVVAASLVAAAALVPASAVWVGLDLSPLVDRRTWSLTGELFAQSWPPSVPGGTGSLLVAALDTLAMSVVAVALALVVGCALAAVAARSARRVGVPRRVTGLLARAVLVGLRAIPPPVWALLALFVFLPGLLPGAVALGVYTAGVLGRLVAESVENLDPRPAGALRAGGATPTRAALYAVVPAAVPRVVAYGLYRWEVTIRETVVVGVVGAGGLGLLLQTALATFDYAGALAVVAVLVALTALVDAVGGLVRASLPGRPGAAG